MNSDALELKQQMLLSRMFELLGKEAKLFPIRFDTTVSLESPSMPGVTSTDAVLLQLSNLDLIDTQNTTWGQVLEFRKDHRSAQEIRRLVHFCGQNYDGKDANYIKDDIEIRIEDYQTAVTKWGGDTTTGRASLVFDSKSILATGGMALAISGTCLLGT